MMLDILRNMKEDTCIESRSLALKDLFQRVMGDNELKSDANKLDFVMEDGIQTIVTVISSKGCPSLQVHQGMCILRTIADDSMFHLLSSFDAIGGLAGIVELLENHHTEATVLKDVFFLLYKLMKNEILNYDAEKVLRWMSLFDLLAEGVEANLHHVDVFKSFCFFLTINPSPPQELRQRITLCLRRGLSLHIDDDTCQSIGQSSLQNYKEQQKRDERIIFSFGINRSAAAA